MASLGSFGDDNHSQAGLGFSVLSWASPALLCTADLNANVVGLSLPLSRDTRNNKPGIVRCFAIHPASRVVSFSSGVPTPF